VRESKRESEEERRVEKGGDQNFLLP